MNQQIIFWIVLGVVAILVVRQYLNHRTPLKALLFGTLSGVLTLFPMSFFLAQAGIVLSINAASLAVAAVLGIPGVVGLAVFSVIL